MRTCISFSFCTFVLAFLLGCHNNKEVVVTQYGPEFLSYKGPRQQFDDACRKVLHDFSAQEKTGVNSIKYPYYGEGVSSNEKNGKTIAMQSYLKTKDEENVEYKITTIVLAKNDPVVLLECTGADRHKLINALNEEFYRQGIKVKQYK